MLEQTYSGTNTGDKIKVYEFLEALGLLDNEVASVNMDDDNNSESDIYEEDSDDDQDNYWDPRKRYTGWDYKRRFVKEHNALLDALADPVKGWDLNNY
ncbi:hypothetical protein C1646_776080 [Rhizophagus diaphanus]|nr:hypothetical protein C1646_776080 [Rhizophagus diaphanus] [Rhizophagus sp. MUCL 43196]